MRKYVYVCGRVCVCLRACLCVFHTGVLRVHPVELLRKRAFRAHYSIIGTRTYSRKREPGAVAMVFVELQ